MQALAEAPSRLHWNVHPGSAIEKPIDGLGSLLGFDGAVIAGEPTSTVQL